MLDVPNVTEPASSDDLLATSERAVERGIMAAEAAYFDTGDALNRIRSQKLYKKRDRSMTWQTYCLTTFPGKNWSIDPATASRMINAFRTVQNLLPIGKVPKHESVVRQVRKASRDPEIQREVWQLALNASATGNPTASEVKAAAEVVETKHATTTITTDSKGNQVADQGYVQVGDGDEMAPATPAAQIDSVQSTVIEGQKGKQAEIIQRRLNLSGQNERDYVVSSIDCRLEGFSIEGGRVTFIVPPDKVRFIHSAFRDNPDSAFRISIYRIKDQAENDDGSDN